MILLYAFSNYGQKETTGGGVYSKILVDRVSEYSSVEKVIVLTESSDSRFRIRRRGKVMVFEVLIPALKNGERRTLVGRLFRLAFNQSVLCIAFPLLNTVFRPNINHIHASFLKLGRKGGAHNNVLEAIIRATTRFVGSKVLIDLRGPSALSTTLSRFDHVICCSKNLEHTLLDNGLSERKCTYVPVPFDLDSVSEDIVDTQKYQPYICFVGRMVESKGIFDLIEAFNIMSRRGDLEGRSLVLVGANLEGERFASRVGCVPDIEYMGQLPHSKTLSIIRQSELFILPSRSEGMPRSCLEALALGKKVLLPPGVDEFTQECPGYVLETLDPGYISLRLKNALSSDETPQYDLSKHEVERIVDSTIKLYNRLIQKRTEEGKGIE